MFCLGRFYGRSHKLYRVLQFIFFDAPAVTANACTLFYPITPAETRAAFLRPHGVPSITWQLGVVAAANLCGLCYGHNTS